MHRRLPSREDVKAKVEGRRIPPIKYLKSLVKKPKDSAKLSSTKKVNLEQSVKEEVSLSLSSDNSRDENVEEHSVSEDRELRKSELQIFQSVLSSKHGKISHSSAQQSQSEVEDQNKKFLEELEAENNKLEAEISSFVDSIEPTSSKQSNKLTVNDLSTSSNTASPLREEVNFVQKYLVNLEEGLKGFERNLSQEHEGFRDADLSEIEPRTNEEPSGEASKISEFNPSLHHDDLTEEKGSSVQVGYTFGQSNESSPIETRSDGDPIEDKYESNQSINRSFDVSKSRSRSQSGYSRTSSNKEKVLELQTKLFRLNKIVREIEKTVRSKENQLSLLKNRSKDITKKLDSKQRHNTYLQKVQSTTTTSGHLITLPHEDIEGQTRINEVKIAENQQRIRKMHQINRDLLGNLKKNDPSLIKMTNVEGMNGKILELKRVRGECVSRNKGLQGDVDRLAKENLDLRELLDQRQREFERIQVAAERFASKSVMLKENHQRLVTAAQGIFKEHTTPKKQISL